MKPRLCVPNCSGGLLLHGKGIITLVHGIELIFFSFVTEDWFLLIDGLSILLSFVNCQFYPVTCQQRTLNSVMLYTRFVYHKSSYKFDQSWYTQTRVFHLCHDPACTCGSCNKSCIPQGFLISGEVLATVSLFSHDSLVRDRAPAQSFFDDWRSERRNILILFSFFFNDVLFIYGMLVFFYRLSWILQALAELYVRTGQNEKAFSFFADVSMLISTLVQAYQKIC